MIKKVSLLMLLGVVCCVQLHANPKHPQSPTPYQKSLFEKSDSLILIIDSLNNGVVDKNSARLYQLTLSLTESQNELVQELKKIGQRLEMSRYSNQVMSSQTRLQALKLNSELAAADSDHYMLFFWLNFLGFSIIILLQFRKRTKVSISETDHEVAVLDSVNKATENDSRPNEAIVEGIEPISGNDVLNVSALKGEAILKDDEPNSNIKLTRREQDVLNLICEFKSNPEIARELFISKNTTKTHVSNILRKLKVSNRRQAINKAKKLNLLDQEKSDSTNKISMPMSTFNTLLFMILIMSGAAGYSQTTLSNESDCTYIVKINLVEEGKCRLIGEGPLVILKPDDIFQLPPLPKGIWVVAYGVEEVSEGMMAPLLIGDDSCDFKDVIENFGQCKAKLEYGPLGLLITSN